MKKKIGALLLAGSLMVSALTGCGGGGSTQTGKDDLSEQAHLKWVIFGEQPESYPEVIEQVNEYLLDKINATLELEFVQTGDFVQKVNLMMASNDDTWDLMFTSNWKNDYETNVQKGAYYDLTDMLQEETPELYNYFDEYIWEAMTVGGSIYAIPMNQVMYQQRGMWFKKDIVEKYDLDVENVKSFDDLAAIYQVVKENEPDMIPLSSITIGQFMPLKTEVVAGFEIVDGKVTDRLDEKYPSYEVARDWYLKDYIPREVNFEETTYIKTGKLFSRYNRYLPGVESKFKISNSFEIVAVPTTEMMMRRADIQGAATAINRSSKYPLRALKLLELMTTDQYLFNLMAYGIEGVNYTKDGNRITPTENPYYVAEYIIGNQFLAYLMPGYEDTVWEETDRLNHEAPVDENIGFQFDRETVETELANLTSATEYGTSLEKGTAEDVAGTFEKHKEKRALAGDTIVKQEIERQYEEWKAQQE